MTELRECEGCARRVNVTEQRCPFCATELPPAPRALSIAERLRTGISRAEFLALAAAVSSQALPGCSDSHGDGTGAIGGIGGNGGTGGTGGTAGSGGIQWNTGGIGGSAGMAGVYGNWSGTGGYAGFYGNHGGTGAYGGTYATPDSGVDPSDMDATAHDDASTSEDASTKDSGEK